MPAAPADALPGRGRLPEPHGRISTLPDRRFPRWSAARRARIAAFVLWGNLICQMGIILTGGAVRLTGSGLGCSTWPNCEPGQFTPQITPESTIHPFIEFGNRSLTGVLSVFSVLVWVIAWRWLAHKGRGFRLLALVPLVGTLVQAVVGMAVVLLHLHPGVVSPHFLLSPLLVAVSTVLVVRLYEGDGLRRRVAPTIALPLFAVLAVVGFTVLVLGTLVTGTGPHSGDAGEVTRLPFDPVVISRIHSMSVYVFCAVLVALLIVAHRASGPLRPLRRALWLLVAVTALQGAVGYAQYYLGLPEVLVFFHMVGTTLFAAATTLVGTRLVTWTDPPSVVDAAAAAAGTAPAVAEAPPAEAGSSDEEAAR